MADKGGSPGFKELVSVIRKSPALSITVLAAVVIFIYYVYKGSGTTSSTGNIPAGSYYVAYVDDNNPNAGVAPSGSGTTGTPGSGTTKQPGPTPTGRIVKLTKAGSLETTPHDINGGKNLTTIPAGSSVNVISGPIKDPKGSTKNYWFVSFNGQQGYVGSDTGSF